MTAFPQIELVYFTGCPHVERARAALREALASSGLPQKWDEWNQYDPASPHRIQGYASPTILVRGQDVTGYASPATASACRSDGVASAEIIRAALTRGSSDGD
jgi:hypothetical protein